MIVYRIFQRVNYADTCRDPDDIRITELGFKLKVEDAMQIANDYIKEHFFQKDTKMHENKDQSWSATDFRSYGPTVIVQPIEIT